MRLTPKQRKRRREAARRHEAIPVPPEHMMGPSAEWMRRARLQLEYWDNCNEWEAKLIDEYGFDRAVRAIRQYVTEQRSRDALEAERQRNQTVRWEIGKGHLPQGY